MNRRVGTYYPPSEHGSETGGLLPGVRELIREQLVAGDFFFGPSTHAIRIAMPWYVERGTI